MKRPVTLVLLLGTTTAVAKSKSPGMTKMPGGCKIIPYSGLKDEVAEKQA